MIVVRQVSEQFFVGWPNFEYTADARKVTDLALPYSVRSGLRDKAESQLIYRTPEGNELIQLALHID